MILISRIIKNCSNDEDKYLIDHIGWNDINDADSSLESSFE
jgi:hypothetical protein